MKLNLLSLPSNTTTLCFVFFVSSDEYSDSYFFSSARTTDPDLLSSWIERASFSSLITCDVPVRNWANLPYLPSEVEALRHFHSLALFGHRHLAQICPLYIAPCQLTAFHGNCAGD